MQALVDITNERFEPEERLLIHEHSGHIDDLPREIRDAVTSEVEPGDLNTGDWIIVLDDDVIISEFTPYRIEVRDE